MTIDRIHILQRTGLLALALLAVLFSGLLKPAPALAYITPDVKTIVVDASFGLSQGGDSETGREMNKILTTSTVVNRDNIKKAAVTYLASRLGGAIPVIVWDSHNPDKMPYGQSTLYIRLDYSVWPQLIAGNTVVVGAIATYAASPPSKPGNYFTTKDQGWHPVESFIVNDDPAQTELNLDAVIARLLDRYGTIHKVPDNE